ncbi:MAG: F0F1 ATP synthase subunit delta [Hydrococcus sp. C42_A2020_068]|uniref:ATP synthase F1 subunit delta n=1 Tax=Pleurocapsa sp. PCC 7327 TaxID=118163 RepID=UPI00029FA492|nr:ATP synthase F1 subunit delta [Pleurocapsa sp. PCC 7327]AFY77094.1 ATP synthase, F1 delta subunit [Pleurocapsa sp. PCC 7327]MBF2022487.1 F0F1 ATP synthase subunit delta [Hydrococcus sp. C42_A2020_068]
MKGSAFGTEVAEPYAQALMAVAQSNNLTDRFGDDIRVLIDLIESSQDLSEFLANPVVKDPDKKAILRRIARESHPYLVNFLMLLVDKRRVIFLKKICEQYLELLRKLKNAVLAEVISATELNERQRQAVSDKVRALTGAQAVELKTKIDPDLIGGVIIKVGSQVYDASLRGQLRRISYSLSSAT